MVQKGEIRPWEWGDICDYLLDELQCDQLWLFWVSTMDNEMPFVIELEEEHREDTRAPHTDQTQEPTSAQQIFHMNPEL